MKPEQMTTVPRKLCMLFLEIGARIACMSDLRLLSIRSLFTLVSKELDLTNPEHRLLQLQEHAVFETPTNDELDSFKELLVRVSQNQHVIMDEHDPILIVLKSIVDNLHPLVCCRWRTLLHEN